MHCGRCGTHLKADRHRIVVHVADGLGHIYGGGTFCGVSCYLLASRGPEFAATLAVDVFGLSRQPKAEPAAGGASEA